MDQLEFGVHVVIISAAGVLSPGPLFFANIAYGAIRGARSGISMAFGHTLVEFALIIILATGLFSLSGGHDSDNHQFNGGILVTIIGIVGGIILLTFATFQIYSTIGCNGTVPEFKLKKTKMSPFLAGIVFSAFNPFFLVWWLSAGLKLITTSISEFDFFVGISLFFAFHIWMDYTWLAITAHLSSKGISIQRARTYRLVMIILSLFLIYFGIYFIITSIQMSVKFAF